MSIDMRKSARNRTPALGDVLTFQARYVDTIVSLENNGAFELPNLALLSNTPCSGPPPLAVCADVATEDPLVAMTDPIAYIVQSINAEGLRKYVRHRIIISETSSSDVQLSGRPCFLH